jgi:hypothetical protein
MARLVTFEDGDANAGIDNRHGSAPLLFKQLSAGLGRSPGAGDALRQILHLLHDLGDFLPEPLPGDFRDQRPELGDGLAADSYDRADSLATPRSKTDHRWLRRPEAPSQEALAAPHRRFQATARRLERWRYPRLAFAWRLAPAAAPSCTKRAIDGTPFEFRMKSR